MGARWWKDEEKQIQAQYPTATKVQMMVLIPNRTWLLIGVKARKMRVHRNKEAKGMNNDN